MAAHRLGWMAGCFGPTDGLLHIRSWHTFAGAGLVCVLFALRRLTDHCGRIVWVNTLAYPPGARLYFANDTGVTPSVFVISQVCFTSPFRPFSTCIAITGKFQLAVLFNSQLFHFNDTLLFYTNTDLLARSLYSDGSAVFGFSSAVD